MASRGTGTRVAAASADAEAGAPRGSSVAKRDTAHVEAKSSAIAAEGVTTGEQFARLMSALMSDVIEGRLSPQVSNAAVAAGGKLLKVVEMEYKYGRGDGAPEQRKPTLMLAPTG